MRRDDGHTAIVHPRDHAFFPIERPSHGFPQTLVLPSDGRTVGRGGFALTVKKAHPLLFFLGQYHFAPDFTTAKRVVKSINNLLGENSAEALDAVSIAVQAPKNSSQRVEFLSLLENIEVAPADGAAKVIINSRTGTIVMGQNVRIFPVAITHGSLTVTVDESLAVSQPEGFSQGETAVVPKSTLTVNEELVPMFKFAPGPTLDDVVRAVNEVGAAPGDVMAILEALKQAGALRAELVVI